MCDSGALVRHKTTSQTHHTFEDVFTCDEFGGKL